MPPYLYRAQDGKLIGIGYYSGSQYNNYGIKISDHGIDSALVHTYRLTNKVNDNGSNMIYLSVDGKELGAMNNYFVGTVSQGTTSNWLSGRDMTFDYMGNTQYPLNGTYDRLEVWEEGKPCTIEFRDHDGRLLSTVQCKLGDVPAAPADPVRAADERYTYTFTGWEPAITAAEGDCEYVATYKQDTRAYTVTFVNEDGTVLSRQTVLQGQMPTAPAAPLKAPTLEFKDIITVNAFYTAENIQDVVEMGMITYNKQVSSWSVDTADHVIPGATYVESSGRYYSSSQGIYAKYLGDTVYLAVYAKATAVYGYHAKQYFG